MDSTYLTGKKGEEIAFNFLNENDFSVFERNWRYSKFGEIDLIAIDKKTKELVFIEVKTRMTTIGDAKELVTQKKQVQIYKMACAYMHYKKIQNINCRFDVIAICLKSGKICLEHVKKAFVLEI